MNRLEERYRRLLRVLPRSYRQQWEDDMVATYLLSTASDDPDEARFMADYGSPSAAEVRSVLALAVRLRLGGAGAPPGYRLLGAAIRRFALLTLLLHAAQQLVSGVFEAWYYADPPDPASAFPANAATIVFSLMRLLIVPAFLALVFGFRRTAATLAVFAVLPSFVSAVTFASHGGFLPTSVGQFVFDVLPICALAAFHSDAPPVPKRPWLIAFAGAVLLNAALPVVARFFPVPRLLLYAVDITGVWCGFVCLVAVVYAITVRSRSAGWPMAIAMLAFATLGLRLLTLPSYAVPTETVATRELTPVIVEAAVVAVTAMIATVLARREFSSFRAAPATPAPSGPGRTDSAR